MNLEIMFHYVLDKKTTILEQKKNLQGQKSQSSKGVNP